MVLNNTSFLTFTPRNNIKIMIKDIIHLVLYLILFIVFVLYLCDTTITFKPFSIKMESWRFCVGWFFILIGVYFFISQGELNYKRKTEQTNIENKK